MLINRILFAAAYIASVFYVYYYGGKVPYMLFYMMTAVIGFSFLYTYITFKSFECDETLSRNEALKGESLLFKFTVRNKWRLFVPYLRVLFKRTNKYFCSELTEKKFSLLPKEFTTYEYTINCRYRGRYEICVDKVIIEDFLGIFRFVKTVNRVFPVLIKPNIIQLDLGSFSSDITNEVSMDANKNNNDSQLVSDVRDYVYGDSLRKVHWKLSGKYDKLLVKNFQGTTDFNNMIVLDLNDYTGGAEDHVIVEDKVIEALISLAYFLTSQHIGYELVYYDGILNDITVASEPDFDLIYDILSEIEFRQKLPAADFISAIKADSVKKSNLIFLTTSVSFDLCARLIEAHEAGNLVTLVYASPTNEIGDETKAILSTLEEKRIGAISIGIDSDIKLILEGSAGRTLA